MVQLGSTTLPRERLSTWLNAERATSFLLSIVSGFVDTASFVALSGLFTAHITGNLVLAGAALASPNQGSAVARLLMLPIFMITITAVSLLARRVRAQGRSARTALLAGEAIGLLCFMIIGLWLAPNSAAGSETGVVIVVGGVGVIAMGFQNALMREALSSHLPTTVMTGTLTQATIDLLTLVTDPAEAPTARKRLGRHLPVLGGFLLGSAGGAYGVTHLHFWCMLLPCAVIATLACAGIEHAPKR